MSWCFFFILQSFLHAFAPSLVYFGQSRSSFSWLNRVTVGKDEVLKLVQNLKAQHMLFVFINTLYLLPVLGHVEMNETNQIILFLFIAAG